MLIVMLIFMRHPGRNEAHVPDARLEDKVPEKRGSGAILLIVIIAVLLIVTIAVLLIVIIAIILIVIIAILLIVIIIRISRPRILQCLICPIPLLTLSLLTLLESNFEGNSLWT